MSITVLNPGLLTTVQDMGRVGYQQFGVSVSGVMDPRATALARMTSIRSANSSMFWSA